MPVREQRSTKTSNEGENVALRRLNAARLIFWDFDGVIKDSLDVKSEAFEQLFVPHGIELAKRVRAHHEAHGGVSRFEKIPLYLLWSGVEPTDERVAEYCDRFAAMVRDGVIGAPWVPGVEAYLRANNQRQLFVLLTATPQQEIETIVEALTLTECFAEVHGAPLKKSEAMRQVLERRNCDAADAVMVGDSATDYEAAVVNGVAFVLRRTLMNASLQQRHRGASFERLEP